MNNEHLTTELQQTSLDMDDFQEPAVQCFIVAAYVGELEDINKDIFRDVNKMSHVFDVSWLEERCGEYFKLLKDCVRLFRVKIMRMYSIFSKRRGSHLIL